MNVNKKRPVNLSLGQVISVNMSSPVAVASILHRISGIVTFALIPVMLYVLQLSLSSEQGFSEVQQMMSNIFVRLGIAIFVAALVYHTVMGFKHMLQDLGFGESYKGGRVMSAIALVLGLVLSLAAFIWVMA